MLDSSVAIRAERQGIRVLDLLKQIREATGQEEVGLTAIGMTELLHGIYCEKQRAVRTYAELF